MSAPRVAVVGGGISGLAAAHRLRTLLGPAAEIVVLEQRGRPGGVLRTVDLAGAPYDVGAEAFLWRRPEVRDLLDELGLAGEVVHPAGATPSVRAGGGHRAATSGDAAGRADERGAARRGALAGRAPRRRPPNATGRCTGREAATWRSVGCCGTGSATSWPTAWPIRCSAGSTRAGWTRWGCARRCRRWPPALDAGAPSLTAAADRATAAIPRESAYVHARPASVHASPAPVHASPASVHASSAPVHATSSRLRTVSCALLRSRPCSGPCAAATRRLSTPSPRRAPTCGCPPRCARCTGAPTVGCSCSARAGTRLEVDAVVLAVPAPAVARLLADVAPAAARAAGEIELASSVVVALAYRETDAREPAGHVRRAGRGG